MIYGWGSVCRWRREYVDISVLGMEGLSRGCWLKVKGQEGKHGKKRERKKGQQPSTAWKSPHGGQRSGCTHLLHTLACPRPPDAAALLRPGLSRQRLVAQLVFCLKSSDLKRGVHIQDALIKTNLWHISVRRWCTPIFMTTLLEADGASNLCNNHAEHLSFALQGVWRTTSSLWESLNLLHAITLVRK